MYIAFVSRNLADGRNTIQQDNTPDAQKCNTHHSEADDDHKDKYFDVEYADDKHDSSDEDGEGGCLYSPFAGFLSQKGIQRLNKKPSRSTMGTV